MSDKIWWKEGKPIPLDQLTLEQLLAKHKVSIERYQDNLAELKGANEALKKRLKNHRSAKAAANKRADEAIQISKVLLEKLEKYKELP